MGTIAVACTLLGIYLEQQRLLAEEQLELVEEIAVVNLDEGVSEGNITKFYSTQLMGILDERFVTTSLEEGRVGINNGSYAAYIIVPANFSKNAVSINAQPQKSVLEYAMKPNLREDIGKLILSNIRTSEANLNTNMSYMYVQAILEEFHDVQDSSTTIMKNDTEDMENLLSIKSEELMEDIPYTELKIVDFDIEDVDLSDQYIANQECLNNINTAYQKFVEDGQAALGVIKEDEEVLVTQIDTFATSIGLIDIANDPEWDTGTMPQKPIWEAMSSQYANGATGTVTYVHPSGYEGNVWKNIEKPILDENDIIINEVIINAK